MAKISRAASDPGEKPAYRMPTLETQRVALRPLRTDDMYAIFGFFSDPEVTRYWSRPPMTHLAQARTLLRAMRDGNRTGERLQFGIERRSDAVLMGTCSLFNFSPQNRRAEVGYILGRPFWRQGYMHEAMQRMLRHAFEDLDLVRLEADIDPRNRPSARTLERLGFVKEGYLRERWIVAEAISDTELYGLLRREWIRSEP